MFYDTVFLHPKATSHLTEQQNECHKFSLLPGILHAGWMSHYIIIIKINLKKTFKFVLSAHAFNHFCSYMSLDHLLCSGAVSGEEGPGG